MKILAFDTSLNKSYISLSGDFGVAEKIIETDEKNYHSAYLISGIKEITEKNGINLKDLDLIAVNHGPGSFTGIRVGVTVAKTMAKELNLKVLGVNSLDILRETYGNLDPDVVLDARRNRFYVGSKNSINLVNYDEIGNFLTKKAVICDASSFSRLNDPLNPYNLPKISFVNFEEDNFNLSLSLLNLAKKRFLASFDDETPSPASVSKENKEKSGTNFTWDVLKPMYLQSPPIHGGK